MRFEGTRSFVAPDGTVPFAARSGCWSALQSKATVTGSMMPGTRATERTNLEPLCTHLQPVHGKQVAAQQETLWEQAERLRGLEVSLLPFPVFADHAHMADTMTASRCASSALALYPEVSLHELKTLVAAAVVPSAPVRRRSALHPYCAGGSTQLRGSGGRPHGGGQGGSRQYGCCRILYVRALIPRAHVICHILQAAVHSVEARASRSRIRAHSRRYCSCHSLHSRT